MRLKACGVTFGGLDTHGYVGVESRACINYTPSIPHAPQLFPQQFTVQSVYAL
jgi:hypothetical protein